MSAVDLPEGTYFSVIGNVRLEAGGQTRMALLRHRLFEQHAGVSLPILTYNPVPSYAPIRAELLARGQLLPTSVLRNLHEELRTWDLPAGRGDLPDLGAAEDDVEGDYLWRRRFLVDQPGETWDYFRPDGTRYLRTPPTDVDGDVVLCGSDGAPVETWPGIGGLWRWWTRHVVPDSGSVFLISDSRFIAEELGLLGSRRIHLVHQMHNPHVTGARLWGSPVAASYRRSMESLGDLDGLVSLTDRQRDDIARRYGDTSNLFVIPNPVESPPMPDPAPARDPHRIVMIARLEKQKRVDRAIDAFVQVHAAIPDATLDVYGDGPLLDELQTRIDAAGLTGAVTLHGHDPAAREALWTASLFWLTSQFEGYPLSTLEAMSHRVPVVSMDVTYGPREQITDGVDGVLVPVGDLEAMADRTVELLRDPARVESMRDAAREKAEAHGHARFLDDWRLVLQQVAVQKTSRAGSTAAHWETHARATGSTVSFSGMLDLGTFDDARLDEVRVFGQAWAPDHAELVEIPLEVDRSESQFRFRGSVDLPPDLTRVRVGYVWANQADFTDVWQREPRRRWFRRR